MSSQPAERRRGRQAPPSPVPPEPVEAPPTHKKRSYVSQTDVPGVPLSEALRVGQALSDNYARQPTKPLHVATALGLTPSSGGFRLLTGASQAYGLTEGGAYAPLISLTDLGRRIVAPTREGDDLVAKKEALLRPRVVREFLQRYNNSKLPPARIAKNVLDELGVPSDVTERIYNLILKSAEELGVLTDVKGNLYVDLDMASPPATSDDTADEDDDPPAPGAPGQQGSQGVPLTAPAAPAQPSTTSLGENRKVFITHGKNREIVQQIKELLAFGDFEPVVSVERETVSKPIPKKVIDDMRMCAAAIIHVGHEQKVLGADGQEQIILNQNVLIEIGAAMALYEDRFILLVERGVELPSNLQGLYEVRHVGDKLDYDSTVKLLRAFNDFKSAKPGM